MRICLDHNLHIIFLILASFFFLHNNVLYLLGLIGLYIYIYVCVCVGGGGEGYIGQCVCVCVCVWGKAILANFQPNFLNPLVLMCGCLDRHIDTFLIRVSFDMHR